MRLSKAIVLVGMLALLWSASAASAEPPTRSAPYKAPIVASLSAGEDNATPLAHATSGSRARHTARRSILSSPGGQLATTAAVFVFAMFLASLASRRS
jgi:hypothetical protein